MWTVIWPPLYQVRADLQHERDEKVDLVTDKVKIEEQLAALNQQYTQVSTQLLQLSLKLLMSFL